MAVIGIMDSGVGGLSVFREILKLLPKESYIYYSDSAYCPYGEKNPSEVLERCREITKELVSRGAQVIVIACNTATAAAINILRNEFPIPFIGMEPAVKPAALGTKTGVVGVLATAGTLRGSKYLKTRDSLSEGVKIVESIGQGFVELVESGELEGSKVESIVSQAISPLLNAGADTIVLGCTHYPFLATCIQKIAGPEIKLIDPAPAVAKHLLEVLKQNSLTLEDPSPNTILLSSGNREFLKSFFKKLI